jgi:aryl-alcohol dehydrogenase-like predicted oxidoreductase
MASRTCRLGNSDLTVSTIGLGCMGMAAFYGPPLSEQQAVDFLQGALDRGVTHFDTAEMYGYGLSESMIGKALSGRRGEFILATKFGPHRDPDTGTMTVDGSPENVRRSVEGSLKRLQTDLIDLYYLHRVDPDTPIQETVGEMARLVAEGKVRSLGLSEASARTLRRANEVHPITALQSEYSLFSRDIEDEILPACRELGTSLVAYSPLGRGILSGRWQKAEDRPAGKGDFRAETQPRYSPENFAANLNLVDTVREVADRHGIRPAQVALAWVLSRGEDIVTIPGTTRIDHLETNLGALDVELDRQDLDRLARLASEVRGARYNDAGMQAIDR